MDSWKCQDNRVTTWSCWFSHVAHNRRRRCMSGVLATGSVPFGSAATSNNTVLPVLFSYRRKLVQSDITATLYSSASGLKTMKWSSNLIRHLHKHPSHHVCKYSALQTVAFQGTEKVFKVLPVTVYDHILSRHAQHTPKKKNTKQPFQKFNL